MAARTGTLARRQSFKELAVSIRDLGSGNALGIVLFLFVLTWIAFVLWHSVPFASLETDGMEYIQTAQSLFTPAFSYSSYHGIGYPFAIWLIHLPVQDWFLSAKVASGIAGFAFIAATFLLFEILFGRRVALLGSLLVITNFFVVSYSGMAMADMAGASLALLSTLVLVRGKGTMRYAWSGALAGLGAITRYQYFGLIALAAAVWWLETDNRSRLRASVLFSTAFALAVAPLLLLNLRMFGNPLFSSNFSLVGGWVYQAHNSAPANSWRDILSTVASDPMAIAIRYLRKVGLDVPLYLVHVVYYAIFFTIPGWVLALQRKQNRRELLLFLSSLAVYVLVTSLGWMNSERYWLFVIPFLVGGCVFLVQHLVGQDWRWGLGLMLLLLGVNLAGAMDNLPRFAAEQAPEFMRAGMAIRQTTSPDAVILVSQPQIAYFAERPSVLLRDVPQKWIDLMTVITKHKVEYVVMDERYGTGHYPELARLLDAKVVAPLFPHWQVVYSESKAPRIVVYRVSDQ